MQTIATHTQPTAARLTRRGAALLGASLTAAVVSLPASAFAQSAPIVTTRTQTFTNLSSIPGISGVTNLSYPLSGCFSADDCLSSAITLPFTFRYYGSSQTSIRVDSNAFFAFGSGASFSDFSNDTIPSSNNPNNAIMPWWDDNFGLGLSYGTVGTAPSRAFVIELRFRPLGGSGTGRVQLWLLESTSPTSDGVFEVHYGGSIVNARSASVGFENSRGSAGVQVETCTPNCSNFGSLVNNVWRVGAPDGVELTASFGTNSFPRGGFPGTTVTGTVTVENIGTTTATTVLTEMWLSTDTTFDAATDIRVGTATTASVPNGTVDQPVTLNLPSSLAAGDYTLFAFVDANTRYTELLESNNIVAADQRFATAYELAGNGCRVTNPQGVNPGEVVNFEIDLVNNGVPYSGSLAIELRASTDAAFDASDPVLSTTNINFTGSNLETGSGSFTLASGALTPGRYFPICVIDPANAVTETSETNNIVVGSQRFGSGPDFTVGAVTMPAQVPPGTAVNISTTIDNTAVPFTGTVQYRLYASTDDQLDPMTDIDLGIFDASFAGESSLADVESVTFASSIPGGRYRIIAVVDPRTRIAEVDETNNQGVSATDIVNAIDFVALSATVDVSTVQANDPMRVTGTTNSTGLSFVGNVPFGVYLSSDESFDATDFLAYRGLNFFPGNTSASVDVTFPAPAVPPGTYNVLVVVNPDNNPTEADTTNNAARASRTVTVVGAELRAESLTAPDIAFIGRDMEVTINIVNESQAADARGFRYAYYLSENDLIRVTDRQVAVSSTITIAAGASQTFTDQVPIPSSFTSTQSLYLGVVVDVFSAVPEGNEGNNIRRKPTPIAIVFPIPDLQAQIVTTATSAAAGEQLAVTRLISNSGVADATTFDFTYYLSENPTISTDDLPIGTYSGSLPTNSDDFGIDILDIPPSVPAGTYYVGLIMDPNDMVEEVSETNNAAVGPAIPVFGAAITFITDEVPDGTVGVAYQTGVYARGGPLPITWSVSQGSLPDGLSLDTTGGIISGTPMSEGLSTFTLRASSGTAFTEREFSIRVTSPTVPLEIATTTLRSAVASRAYSADLVAVGGVPPYQWSAISGLPNGLTLSETGRLEGEPTTPGQFTITLSVQDDLNNSRTAQVVLNVVSPGQTIQVDQVPLPQPTVGVPYCSNDNPVTFSARNGTPPYTWSASGMIPQGMTFNEDGELCGTPEIAGTNDMVVRVQDASGLFDTALFRIEVRGADECGIATFTLPEAQAGQPYTTEDGGAVRLLQAQCTEPLMDWMLVDDSGSLPPGLTLAADGTISGTPTSDGNFAFIAMIVDATMTSAIQPLSITVNPEPTVEPPRDDGCTCATPEENDAPLAWLALLPGLALVLRRRRR